MSARARATLRIATGSWKLSPAAAPRGRRRAAGAGSGLLQQLAATRRVALESEHRAELTPRRGGGDEPLRLELAAPGQGYVIAVHYESGAVTFHAPDHTTERRRGRTGRTGPVSLRFTVPVRAGSASPGRRGALLRKIVNVVVVKLVGKAADWALERLARKWEAGRWTVRHRGLVHVDPNILALGDKGALPLADPSRIARRPARNLLLIHGTFSSAETGFEGLAQTAGTDGRKFFAALSSIYGDRVFAFNHFTVSESPEDNARALLRALPASGGVFDVITHSRGALVLRTIVERGAALGPEASRFALNRAILCAGPNQGTPLADGGRWDTIASWLANLTDLVPDNPFTFVVDFLAESLKWLARAATESLPGIAAMDPAGDVIAELQEDPAPPANAYWALAANYEPGDTLVRRAADFGVDAFFGTANDIVVPTSGGWRVDPGAAAVIPGGQIACYGPGGNVRIGGPADVHHCNLFSQPETIDLLIRMLGGEALRIPALDPAADLPVAGEPARRGAAPSKVASRAPQREGGAAAVAGGAPVRSRPSLVIPRAEVVTLTDAFGRESTFVVPTDPPADENFNLFLLASETSTEQRANWYLIASYRNARVLERFEVLGKEYGRRWRRIIDAREHIVQYIDGNPKFPSLPNEQDLRGLGRDLFEVLFPGDIRRLYDHARADFAKTVNAQVAERRLSIIFTSMLGWVAEKPWEFAYDPSRNALLAAQEVNFVRNVLTAVPAEARPARVDKLRILVVAAQPVGAAPLSASEEEAVIMRGFRPLVDQQLAEVQVVPSVTPERLHELMESSAYGNDPIDVLHFIGHGEYRLPERMGYLLFENDEGGIQEINAEIITQIVAKRGIRLVFLNACETGAGYAPGPRRRIDRRASSPRFDFASGVAPALVEAGVPSVVANQFPVLDPSAAAFARHFYGALARGRSIGDAAREARVAVNYSITGEAIDWAIPVVFARNPHERLVVAPASVDTAPTTAVPATGGGGARRRGPSADQVVVAIWDVNHVVPDLEGVVRRMNAAQDFFRFQVADITAPLGTWRRLPLDPQSASRTGPWRARERQLDSAELIEKLSGLPAQLGVNQVVCVTNFGLADDEQTNIEGETDPEQGISVVSTAGVLEALTPPETSIERLVVNQSVAYINPVPAHVHGVKRCPNYYNKEKRPAIMAGRIGLCAACRRALRRMPNGDRIIAALDALLALPA